MKLNSIKKVNDLIIVKQDFLKDFQENQKTYEEQSGYLTRNYE